LCDQCYSDIYGQSRLNQSNRNGQNSRDGVSNGGKGNDLEDRDTVEDIGLGSGSDRRQMFGDGYDDRNGVGKNIGSRETTGREGIGENSVRSNQKYIRISPNYSVMHYREAIVVH
jgi:hypothetical protein